MLRTIVHVFVASFVYQNVLHIRTDVMCSRKVSAGAQTDAIKLTMAGT